MAEYNVYINKMKCSKLEFSNNPALVSVDSPLPYINTTSVSSMFYGCRNIKTIPQNIFENNPQIEDMARTFGFCYNLTGNIPNIPDSVTSMAMTFHQCGNLTGTIPNIPDSVRDIRGTFYSCKNLRGNVPNIPNSVTSMAGTFYNCSNLTSLDISNFNAKKVTNMYQMFENYESYRHG